MLLFIKVYKRKYFMMLREKEFQNAFLDWFDGVGLMSPFAKYQGRWSCSAGAGVTTSSWVSSCTSSSVLTVVLSNVTLVDTLFICSDKNCVGTAGAITTSLNVLFVLTSKSLELGKVRVLLNMLTNMRIPLKLQMMTKIIRLFSVRLIWKYGAELFVQNIISS